MPEVDAAIDCVGFEARGCGHAHSREMPAQVLNDLMLITKAGGGIGIPGLYVTEVRISKYRILLPLIGLCVVRNFCSQPVR